MKISIVIQEFYVLHDCLKLYTSFAILIFSISQQMCGNFFVLYRPHTISRNIQSLIVICNSTPFRIMNLPLLYAKAKQYIPQEKGLNSLQFQRWFFDKKFSRFRNQRRTNASSSVLFGIFDQILLMEIHLLKQEGDKRFLQAKMHRRKPRQRELSQQKTGRRSLQN